MFIDVSRYSFLREISENVSLISDELRRAVSSQPHVRDIIKVEMAMDFPSNQWTWDNGINSAAFGYDLRDGGYSMLAVYKKEHVITAMDTHAVFRETLKLLAGVKGLHYAAFSALSPGAHLGLHTHSRSHFIYHILLNDLIEGECKMICDGHAKILKKTGDTALFDYSLPHETYNYASNTRMNLMIDFLP
jgi:aspartyl/asparaginyl beta-hydroxylase (cupin superfamily)